MKRLCTGFSLIELLVAVAVFALASALAWAGLSAVTDSRQRLALEQRQFASVQRSVDFLARDLATAVDRSVRAGRGGRRPALVGDQGRVAFTRMGMASELQSSSSALERVVWFVDNKALVRGRYAELDRPDDRGLSQRHMDDDIRGFELRYLDHSGSWHERWPPPADRRNADPAALPRAVEFRIRFESVGQIRRVIELASAQPKLDAPL
ncbi:MAG: type II secretion system minor pseudopilin GspJ [Rhodanobacteraceae bacterium]